MPEKRDIYGEELDPVSTYYATKNANKKFFRMKSADKIDLYQFGKPNYLTSPTNGVGITQFKNYLTDKKGKAILEDAGGRTLGKTRSLSSKREYTVKKYELMKKMLANEKKVS